MRDIAEKIEESLVFQSKVYFDRKKFAKDIILDKEQNQV